METSDGWRKSIRSGGSNACVEVRAEQATRAI